MTGSAGQGGYVTTKDVFDGLLPILTPIMAELKEAIDSVQRIGFGSVTLRFERGKVKQVTFEGSYLATNDLLDKHNK